MAPDIPAAVAAGLHHAHERKGPDKKPLNVVHRDVSPSNLIIGYDGSVKIVDFGIAKAIDAGITPLMTVEGVSFGSPEYMSPEQVRDASSVDHRADLFAKFGKVRRQNRGRDDEGARRKLLGHLCFRGCTASWGRLRVTRVKRRGNADGKPRLKAEISAAPASLAGETRRLIKQKPRVYWGSAMARHLLGYLR